MAKILFGLTGSVSVYKSINAIRQIESLGHDTKVVLTLSAEKFISPLLVSSVTKGDVYSENDFWKYGKSLHIELARWADLIAIVPCTANTLSKIRYGIADNLLTSTILAFKGPLVIAPAMHQEMWLNPQVQDSVQYLKEMRGVFFSGPARGTLASGEAGCGRLLNEEYIVEDIEAVLRGRPLKGKKVLVCYGRTEEPIDSVRVITNKSSGLMGFYLCKAVKEHGGELIQVVGETSIEPYGRGEIVKVRTSEDMYNAVTEKIKDVDILIMAAAVSDYKPAEFFEGKLKKGKDLKISLTQTVDILKSVSSVRRENQVIVGFALETEHLREYAQRKLEEKSLDIVIANYSSAMGSETTDGMIIDKFGNIDEFAQATKRDLAIKIIERVIKFIL